MLQGCSSRVLKCGRSKIYSNGTDAYTVQPRVGVKYSNVTEACAKERYSYLINTSVAATHSHVTEARVEVRRVQQRYINPCKGQVQHRRGGRGRKLQKTSTAMLEEASTDTKDCNATRATHSHVTEAEIEAQVQQCSDVIGVRTSILYSHVWKPSTAILKQKQMRKPKYYK